jgi:hypothetical protein
MRVRDHVALSTATAALLYPLVGRSVLGAWVASIFIDVDHYLWFAAHNRRLDPVAAVRSFNDGLAPELPETRLLHHPAVLGTLMVLSSRRRAVLFPVLGMTFHAGLDIFHQARTKRAQAAALDRDGFTCRVCGAKDGVVAHVWRQPRLLPSYRLEHFVTVCQDCHGIAHSHGALAIAGVDSDWESYLRDTGLSSFAERRSRPSPDQPTRARSRVDLRERNGGSPATARPR